MAKKAGVFPLLVGAVAGAAAMFFSDKKNRDKAKKVAQQGKKKVLAMKKEAQKDPQAFARKTAAQAEQKARIFARKAKSEANKLAKRAEKEMKAKKRK